MKVFPDIASETGISKATVLHSTIIITRLSQSGLAINIIIDQQLHTVPLRSHIPVLNGNHRKAPQFVPKKDVEPDTGGVSRANYFFLGPGGSTDSLMSPCM